MQTSIVQQVPIDLAEAKYAVMQLQHQVDIDYRLQHSAGSARERRHAQETFQVSRERLVRANDRLRILHQAA